MRTREHLMTRACNDMLHVGLSQRKQDKVYALIDSSHHAHSTTLTELTFRQL